MGGDGGTISSSRLYLRGAGKASHTADHPSNALKRAKVEDAERSRQILTTCAVSGTGFDFAPKGAGRGGSGSHNGGVSGADIVACPHGKLYKREKALEALLERSQSASGDGANSTLGSHIRGMKDLHPVRFQVAAVDLSSKDNGSNGKQSPKKYMPVCPITGSEIASGNIPSFLIVRSKKEKNGDANNKASAERDESDEPPNVLSERAIKEMGVAGLQSEYGPFEEKDMIRLAPPKTGGVLEEIQKKWAAQVEEERLAKQKKKKDKKRKRTDNHGDKPTKSCDKSNSAATTQSKLNVNATTKDQKHASPKKSAADEARSSVQSAVAHSSVLSSLFGAGKKQQSEKEKRDALFTRNC